MALTPRLTHDDAFAAAEDADATSGNLLANDADGGADLTVAAHTQPGHGSVAYNGDGTFTYSPADDFNGVDSFGYTVTDSAGRSDSATVTVTVAAVNDAPVAHAAQVDAQAGQDELIPLGADDVETAIGDLYFEITTPPQHGQVAISGQEATYTADAGYQGPDSFAFTVLDRGDPDGTGAGALTSDPAVVSVNVTAGVTLAIGEGGYASVAYTDADGSVVTVSLSKGSGQVRIGGVVDSQLDRRGRLTLTGADLTLQEIELLDTNARSGLRVKVTGGDGAATVGAISGSTPIGKIDAAAVDLVGDGIVMTGEGVAGSLRMRDVLNGADILMPGPSADRGSTVVLGKVADGCEAAFGSPLKSLTATRWYGSSLAAAFASKIAIKGDSRNGTPGDFRGDLTLTGMDAKGCSLGQMAAAGWIGGGQWSAAGDVGKIKAAGTDDAWTLTALGAIGRVDAAETLGGTLRSMTAWVGRVASRGDLTASIAAGGQDGKGLGIGRVDARGWFDSARLDAAGSIGSVTAAGMTGSSVFAGVSQAAHVDADGDGVWDLPAEADMPGCFDGAAVLGKLRVTGKARDGSGCSFINSTIVAAAVGSVDVYEPRRDNAGVEFGLACTDFGKLTLRSPDGTLQLGPADLLVQTPDLGNLVLRVS